MKQHGLHTQPHTSKTSPRSQNVAKIPKHRQCPNRKNQDAVDKLQTEMNHKAQTHAKLLYEYHAAQAVIGEQLKSLSTELSTNTQNKVTDGEETGELYR
jgi:hypothetical protein